MNVLTASAGLVALLFSAGIANAENRAQFCARWHNVCKKTNSGSPESCRERRLACRTSGCFPFRAFGNRCETDRLTCSEIYRACSSLGVNPDCESARAKCMRTGRWIGKGEIDYGPAAKE